ncbi:hypothetical protein J437_LFUL017556 [Ladona fulva]|uniref:Uncharacterized protein n=1 Tax=Ladona fulva TaxID=123851 RepID=A0A8K0KM68_LADFU|nr:hypothetical protein J437_LFUL017556 [Ladona fulva]
MVSSTSGLKMRIHSSVFCYFFKDVFMTLMLILVFYYVDAIEGSNTASSKSPPWAKKHLPPPPPTLPPLPPSSHHGFRNISGVPSICSLKTCNCTNVLLGGEDVVDISCICNDEERSIRIGQAMLPLNADTLSISDCYGIELVGASLDGWASVSRQHEEEEDSDYYIERPSPATNIPRPLSRLSVHRVTRLTLSPHAVGPVLDVAFEDVRNIVGLPPYTFQPPPTDIPTNETVATWTMHSIVFKNISEIKRVSERAISDVHLSYFHWIDVHVKIVEDNAIHVRIPTRVANEGNPCEAAEVGKLDTECKDPRGTFILAGIVIREMGVKSFDVSGGRLVSIESSQINNLVPSSLSVHGAMEFSFFRNYIIRSVAMFGFDVVAKDVEIYKNRFSRLDENALVGLRPMASQESTLRFEENFLEEVDLMSINFGWKIFTEFSNRRELPNVTGFTFEGNSFADCSCPHLGWIVQVALAEDEPFSSFYSLILDKDSHNYCAKEPLNPMGQHFPCRLPLAGLFDLFEGDRRTCKRIVDAENICAKFSVPVASASKESHSAHLLTILVSLCMAFMVQCNLAMRCN